ncbi:MAG: NADPH-dependent FMN reductase [Nocardioides sp.]
MKIGIVIGSVRDVRTGPPIAEWVLENVSDREGVDFEIVDLASFDVPVYTSATLPMMANKHYDSPAVQAWSEAIDSFDGYIFITPEYNHGVPGGLKNAVDSLGPEWVDKTIAFVSYGADSGVRAVEQWRQIVANFHMHDARSQVALNLFIDFNSEGFAPLERRTAELTALVDDLVKITG